MFNVIVLQSETNRYFTLIFIKNPKVIKNSICQISFVSRVKDRVLLTVSVPFMVVGVGQQDV